MDMMSLRRRVMVNQNKLMTATGNPLMFNTSLTKPLKECVVRFAPKQSGSGTPSPENVREIVGKSSITVYQQGDDGVTHETSVSFPSVTKNLLDSTKRKDGYYIDATGKEIANSNFGYTTAYTPVEPNETYVLSGNIGNSASAYGAIYCYDENKNFVNRLGGFKTNEVPHTFTVPSDTYYINIQYFKDLTDVQIEKGSTATAYEPFDNTVYGGYVDISKGELVAEYYKVPSSAFVQSRQNNGYIAYYYNAPTFKSGDSWFCNLIGEYGSFSTSSMNKNIIQKSRIGGKTYLALDETVDVSTLEIVYPLAEPIHSPLSPRTFTTLQGNNVMWSDGDELTVKYWTR